MSHEYVPSLYYLYLNVSERVDTEKAMSAGIVLRGRAVWVIFFECDVESYGY
jgi:hypothetical protein